MKCAYYIVLLIIIKCFWKYSENKQGTIKNLMENYKILNSRTRR